MSVIKVCLASIVGATTLFGAASSALALRYATPSERRALIRAVEADAASSYPELGFHNDGCSGRFYIVKISTVNRTYGRVTLNNRARNARGCVVGDGYKVFRRTGAGWVHQFDGSWDAAMCSRLGRSLAVDLVRDGGLTAKDCA